MAQRTKSVQFGPDTTERKKSTYKDHDTTERRWSIWKDHEKGLGISAAEVERRRSVASTESGVASITAVQFVWGKKGRYLIIFGLALIMIMYEIDNSIVYIYNNYTTASFGTVTAVASLSTVNTVVFAAVKPPLAKISNVIGRGQTYIITTCFFIVSFIIMATASSVRSFAAGSVLYTMGQSGTNILNDILISDITTARWRAFAIAVSFAPFLFTVWCATYIVESVVAPGGIGWRWGIGMLGILMPFCASFIITTLLYYQRRAKGVGLAPRTSLTFYDFCSQIDLGGIILFTAGLVLLLLPMALAGVTPSEWNNAWLIALIIIGGVLLIILPFYERYMATFPVITFAYFANITILMCLLLVSLDNLSFACNHTYLAAWGIIVHNFSTRDDTYYTYTNGVAQCFSAIVVGLLVAKTRRYKPFIVAGTLVRSIGYGLMLRLQANHISTGELFAVQVIQGIGSGIIGVTLLVPAQISVPHAQMPQITALFMSFAYVGSSIGSCISGGIYTNAFKRALYHHLGDGATVGLVDTLFDTVTVVPPPWGTAERIAIGYAFSDVIRYMTYVSLAASLVGPFMAVVLPDYILPDRHNLVE